jgi:hypothetical protein
MHAERRGFGRVIGISHRWADSEQHNPLYPNDPSRPCLQIRTARKCYSRETSRPHIDIQPSIARQTPPRGADCESDGHRVCRRNLRLYRDTATGYIHFDPSGGLAAHGFQADQRLARPRPEPPVRFRHHTEQVDSGFVYSSGYTYLTLSAVRPRKPLAAVLCACCVHRSSSTEMRPRSF